MQWILCSDVKMVKVVRMGVGALAFAAMDAFGHEALEYVSDEQITVSQSYLEHVFHTVIT